MTKTQEILKADIENLAGEAIIGKIRILIMGFGEQHNIDSKLYKQQNGIVEKMLVIMKN